MKAHRIVSLQARDVRFPLPPGTGSDSVHSGSEYAFATTLLRCDSGLFGSGIVLTLGKGNDLVCETIRFLGEALIGSDLEQLMQEFGAFSRQLADHPQLRWLGPHKGVVHLALASITNACFDLWAKGRGVPLWRLLLDLSPEQVMNLLDLSYLEDALTKADGLDVLCQNMATRASREGVLRSGYRGYDTSVGWFRYDDAKVADLARKAAAD